MILIRKNSELKSCITRPAHQNLHRVEVLVVFVLWILFVGKFQLMGEICFFFEAFEQIPICFLSYPRCFTNLKFFWFRFHHVVVFFPFKGPGLLMKVRAFIGDDDLCLLVVFSQTFGGARCPVNVNRFSKFLSNSSVRRRLRFYAKGQ